MSRLFVHVSVDDLDGSIAFYHALFGLAPNAAGDDFAEWLLDDPCLDFAISRRTGSEPVLTRLGLQVESAEALRALHARLTSTGSDDAGEAVNDDSAASHWAVDTAGVLWEAYCRDGARLGAVPSKAAYIAAWRARDETGQATNMVRYRRLQRRRGPHTKRSEARM